MMSVDSDPEVFEVLMLSLPPITVGDIGQFDLRRDTQLCNMTINLNPGIRHFVSVIAAERITREDTDALKNLTVGKHFVSRVDVGVELSAARNAITRAEEEQSQALVNKALELAKPFSSVLADEMTELQKKKVGLDAHMADLRSQMARATLGSKRAKLL